MLVLVVVAPSTSFAPAKLPEPKNTVALASDGLSISVIVIPDASVTAPCSSVGWAEVPTSPVRVAGESKASPSGGTTKVGDDGVNVIVDEPVMVSPVLSSCSNRIWL